MLGYSPNSTPQEPLHQIQWSLAPVSNYVSSLYSRCYVALLLKEAAYAYIPGNPKRMFKGRKKISRYHLLQFPHRLKRWSVSTSETSFFSSSKLTIGAGSYIYIVVRREKESVSILDLIVVLGSIIFTCYNHDGMLRVSPFRRSGC